MRNRHLRLAQIKSLVARLSISITLEARSLNGGEKELEANKQANRTRYNIVKLLVAEADRLEQHSGRLDDALKKLSKIAKEEVVEGSGAAFEDLRNRLNELARSFARVDCKQCAGELERICCGDPAIDEANLSAGLCIALLHDSLACIVQQACRAYADAAVRVPVIRLSIESTHRDQDADLFREFNISGFCDVIQDEALTSYVVLSIKQGTFDWTAMCGVPYIFAHEVMCHAFQSLHSRVRAIADGKCLWSEAWMDRLAFEMCKHWLERPPRTFPKWFLADVLEIEDQASAIHKFRYTPRGCLTDDEAKEFKRARDAFRLLRDNWSCNEKIDLLAHRAVRFSTCLNASDADNEDREDVAILLGSLLGQDAEPFRAEAALHSCSEFLTDGSVFNLLANLKKIRDMSMESIVLLRQQSAEN
ncbi:MULTISPECIES: hypothetical protein [unclassified Bradyrhizobium]|uniref:hypothetical protein n=1 Tax=unclassified Bradyrhizobium TaxID=2631580 RepID=UPI0028EEF6AD|nr:MULTISPECIES: hypothetical protein [unclassified Bradyrhizobium]